MLWIFAGIMLVVITRTAPGAPGLGLRFRMIGLALAMLAWACLLLAQMQSLVRLRVDNTTRIGRRLVLVTRVLAGLALAAGIIGILRSVIGPDPMPDADPFWVFILSALLAIMVGEIIYGVAYLFARPTVPAERTDAQPR
jgi:hypothetical protein